MGKRGFLGEFEQVVLLVLARLGERAYGMTIHHEIEERIDRSVSITAVYVTLSRLEKKGYVSTRLGEPSPERGGRAKRFYKLEPLGVAALKQSKEVLVRLWEGVHLGADPGQP